ncbi:hypothetical protein LAZ67_4002870, partial [Cordylochernes scorpioides]
MKMRPNDDLKDYLSKFTSLVDNLGEIGAQVPEDLLVILLLCGLPESYEGFRTAIETRDELPKLETLKVKIIEEDQRQREMEGTSSGEQNAFFGNPERKTTNFTKPPNRKEFKFNCHYCGKKGHKAADCWSKRNSKRNNKRMAASLGIRDENILEVDEWCLDSGATAHMCCLRTVFSNLRETEPIAVKLANDQSIEALGTGTVELEVFEHGEPFLLKLENVLFVPGLKGNLISVSTCTEKSFFVKFMRGKAEIVNPLRKICIEAYKRNGLYILRQTKYAKTQFTRMCIDRNSSEIWHNRFGHLNFDDLKKLQRENLVNGLPKGRKPTVSHLRMIGCKCFAVDNRPRRGKFAPRSEEYRLVGYSPESKAYRLWKPGTGMIIKSRDVRFLESENSTLRNDVVQIEAIPQKKRGRGRPRYIRTGKPGRPRKEYPTANLSTQEFSEVKYSPDPKDAEEALSGKDSYFWRKAMKEEFDSLIENKTWELVDPPKGQNVIGSKWVFRRKYSSDGSLERHKARLVAKGFSQQYGIDYEETFAPVVRQSTIRVFFALAVEYNLIVHQMDVQSAYLNGEIKEEVYMAQPENFVSRKYPEKDGSISIDQEKYIEELLAKYRMKEAKPISTPMDSNSKLTKISLIEGENEPVKRVEYQSLIGSLIYLSVSTRPDIAYAVSVLGQFSNDPMRQHWNAAKRVLRYLKGTLCLKITYEKTNETLYGCVDADWGGNLADRKSQTGLVFFLAGGPIAWESKKQQTVALSSTESEYIALCEAGKEAVYLRALLDEMGFGELLNEPTVLKTDNQGAQQLARNPVHHARTKHIDIKWHYIRSICSDGLIEVVHTPTQENVADILTKGLPRVFLYQIEKLNKQNFETWRLQMQMILIHSDLWIYVNEANIKPEPGSQEFSNWQNKNQKALATIVLSLNPSELIHVKNCKTAEEAWKKIEEVYRPKGPATRVSLTKRLIEMKMRPNDDLKDYLSKFTSLVDNLGEIGAQVPEDILVILLLCSLPELYEGIRTAMETRDELPKLETLKVKIIEEDQRQREMEGTSSGEQNAFFGNPERKTTNSTKPPNRKEFKFNCYYCGKKGHKAADCWSKRNSKRNNKRMPASLGIRDENILEVDEWCLDSGATAHMCCLRTAFSNLRETEPIAVKLANDQSIEALGTGTVELEVFEHGEPFLLKLENVLFVPGLKGNLISRENLVNGLPKGEFKSITSCETCIRGKQTRLPFPEVSLTKSTEPLQLIHSDICEPMRTKSYGGALHFATFIDDFSRMIFTFVMKRKNEIFKGFKVFKRFAEKQTGKKIKAIRSDNAAEYLSSDFKEYLLEEGIRHQLSVEYSPQQNGVAERANRTLVEITRCFIIQANLPDPLWAELVHTSTYIRNRCLRTNKSRTLYEIFTGRKPTVSHLRIIGCKCFAVDNRPRRGKFAPRSEEYRLVGYSPESKAYRLWKPGTGMMIKSRDVRFLESENPTSRNDVVQIEAIPQKKVDISLEEESLQDDEITLPGTDSEFLGEPSETMEVISQRGRGRPRYIRTGKPGRPRKEYPTANLSTQEFSEVKYSPDPKDTEEALSGKDSYFWRKAMKEEFDSLIENKTWELRHKARLVAKGFSQKYGIDYEETFAPVVRQSTIRVFLALAVEYNLIVHQMDVQSAYLNGEIKEEVYMAQPENFVSRKYPEKVCRLKKAIYGLKQAVIVWHEKLDTELKYLGLKQIQSDNCVYIKHHEGILLVAIYVDDLIIAAERKDTLIYFNESMKKIFKIKDLGKINYCLGIRIHTEKDGSISIDQEKYIEELLAKYRMKEAKPISTPMDSNSKLTKISLIEGENEPVKRVEYQSLIGSLIYLSVSTRPDIAYAVSVLGQFSNDPMRQHWNAAKRVLRYLKGTLCLKITYEKTNETLYGCVDADWGGNLADRKSQMGLVFFLAGGPIAWESKKQQTVALSSTESEYIALCEAGKEAVYLRARLDEMGFGELLNEPTVLKTDNQGAQQLARNPVHHARTKHIDIKWHYIRSICSDGLIEVVHTPTQENVADILTKGLPRVFLYQIEKLNKQNFETWRLQMQMILIHSDLWIYVNEANIKPEPGSQEFSNWQNKNQKALATIVLSLNPSELIHVKNCKTAEEAWKKIEEVYRPKGPATRVSLTKRLIEMKMRPNGDLKDYLSKFTSLVDNLGEIGAQVPEDILVILLLCSLPELYEGIRTAMETRDELPKLETLKVKIIKEDQRQREMEGTSSGEQNAFFGNPERKTTNSTKPPNRKEFKFNCYYCGKKGHKAADCWSKRNSKRNNKRMPASLGIRDENILEVDEWCLDSGATAHMCCLRTAFSNLRETEPIAVKLANDQSIEALGTGTVELEVFEHGEPFLLKLENVLFVPGLKGNFISRHKARLVAKGFSQKYGIDYEETFAPEVRQSTIRVFFALAVEYNLIVHQMDVQSAYLNGEISEEVYMAQPENFVSRKYPEKVCRLKKAIYGLKQAGIVWHEKLDTELKYLGLKQIQFNNCVYIKHHEGILLVAINVDDLIIAAEREDTLITFKESMKKIFRIKDLGKINYCLGIRIQTKKDGSISIDQEKCIEELLAKYTMKEAKPISTPMDSNSKLTKISSIEGENEPVKKEEYQSLIGSLIYLSMSTRPDIAYEVSALGQFSKDPRRQHWNAAKRVLRYLKGTLCLKITYEKTNETLYGCVDADWGGNLADRKSQTGLVFFLAGGPIAWESKKQQTVALSSTESEYIALCEAGKEAVYLRALLDEMGFGELLNETTVLKTDNQGAQQLARNPVHHARTKHIDIKWHYIRSICSDDLIEVVHTPTQENVADILTKGLPRVFLYQIEKLNKQNFETWRLQMQMILIHCDLWNYVNKANIKPEPGNQEFSKWQNKDQKALATIVLSLNPSELIHVKNCKTAEEARKKIEKVYRPKGPATRVSLTKRLIQMKMRPNDDLKDYLSKFTSFVDNLGEIGAKVPEDLLVVLLLCSLPESYEGFRTAIETRDELPKLETLKVKIIEEDQRQREMEGTSSGEQNAFFGNPERKTTNSTKPPNRKEFKFNCHYCAKKGHKAADCWSKRNSKRNNKRMAASLGIRDENIFEVDEWCLDSGATAHMCCLRTVFSNLRETEPIAVKLANDQSIEALGTGNGRIGGFRTWGKQTRLPFPEVSLTKSTEPLQLIHSDICGPMRTKSYGVALYFATFIDDFSRMIFTFVMKGKNEVFKGFIVFKRFAEKQTGKKIKAIRSDNAAEYLSSDFKEYLLEKGIRHQLSVEYSPQQNGVAERANRTLVEMTRCFIIQANLPDPLWAELVHTSTYIRNRCPRTNESRTPYEIFTGRKPTVSHLRIIGCRCFAVDNRLRRGKFAPRDEEYRLVGYSPESKAYRLWKPGTGMIIKSRDVRFLESENSTLRNEVVQIEAIPQKKEDTSLEEESLQDDENPLPGTDSEFLGEPSETMEVISQRGRGRPRYIRTGKPSRPRKEYPSANLSTQEFSEVKYSPDPKDVEEALSGKDSYFWRKAMKEEFDSLIENKTWELVDPPKGQNVIGSKWVFRRKYSSDGSLERHKARLVAKGFSQQYGIDYEETFAPVVRQSTIRVFFALAVEYNLIVHQMDVQSAYLNGEIKEEIYMAQPENFVSRKYPEKKIQSDNCVYIKHHEGILLVAIYVDDLIIAAERKDTLISFKESMKKIFKIKDLGKINYCLGIRIQTEKDGSISIDQEKYIEELLAKYRMKEAKPISTPMDSNSKLTKISSIEGENEPVKRVEYQSLIGSLIYLSVSTRPDIAYAVSVLGQFSNDPRRQHWNAAKRVLRYLKGTLCLKITYEKTNETLYGCVDADWGGNLADRKSQTGLVFFLAGGPIAWESKKQQTVALSSTESEYIALCEAGKEAVYLRALLDEMGFGELLNEPTVLKTDNQGAQQLARNPVHHARNKHIDIKWHYIRSICSDGLIEVVHTPTQENVADILTKEPVKVDRITEDSSMQRMTEVRDDYFTDALTNMQPHYEDLVNRLKDAMRELAAPRIEKVIIASIDISCATNIFPHRLEQADENHREILALPRQPASTMSHGNHRKKRSPSLIAAHSTRPIQDIHL